MYSANSPRRLDGALATLAANRGGLFAATTFVLLANAAAFKAIESVQQLGVIGAAVNGLGLSWAFWLAYAVCIGLALREPPASATRRDLWIYAAGAMAALVPISPLAAFACTALAVAILFDRTHGVYVRASAMVLLAISVQLFWSRVLMLFFVQPIATLDAHLVGLLANRPVHGHSVEFVQGKHLMSILGPCTSVQNASTAIMLYIAIVRAFRPEPKRSELLGLLGVFASVVAVNLARLALMDQSLEMYHFMHDGPGWDGINAVITLTGLGWAAASVRREIFR